MEPTRVEGAAVFTSQRQAELYRKVADIFEEVPVTMSLLADLDGSTGDGGAPEVVKATAAWHDLHHELKGRTPDSPSVFVHIGRHRMRDVGPYRVQIAPLAHILKADVPDAPEPTHMMVVAPWTAAGDGAEDLPQRIIKLADHGFEWCEVVGDDGKTINVFVLEKKKPAASSAAAAAAATSVVTLNDLQFIPCTEAHLGAMKAAIAARAPIISAFRLPAPVNRTATVRMEIDVYSSIAETVEAFIREEVARANERLRAVDEWLAGWPAAIPKLSLARSRKLRTAHNKALAPALRSAESEKTRLTEVLTSLEDRDCALRPVLRGALTMLVQQRDATRETQAQVVDEALHMLQQGALPSEPQYVATTILANIDPPRPRTIGAVDHDRVHENGDSDDDAPVVHAAGSAGGQ